MTFEEWWAKQTANFDPEEIGLMQLARVTWHAAQEIEREACIAATVAERVDFEATGSDEDEVYNTALWHAVEAMQKRSNSYRASERPLLTAVLEDLEIDMNEVVINGVRYVPDSMHVDEVKFYYMHDNHTFSRIPGTTLDVILANADTMAHESRCGMLCPPMLLVGGKEVRRLLEVAHAPCCDSGDAKWVAGTAAWRKECEADSDVMRLVSSNA